jgi:hypothetical protein
MTTVVRRTKASISKVEFIRRLWLDPFRTREATVLNDLKFVAIARLIWCYIFGWIDGVIHDFLLSSRQREEGRYIPSVVSDLLLLSRRPEV